MGFCEMKPAPGEPLGTLCPECGHIDLVHIGTPHCLVCELLWQLSPQGRQNLALHERARSPLRIR